MIPSPEIFYAVGMQCKPFFVLSLLSLSLWNAQGKPNVVLIYTDDQGSVDAGCYGSEDLHTPAIDRLADTGIRFTNMYAPSAICSASRAGLLTGRIPTRAGVPGNVPSTKGQAGMPAAEITLAELLHNNGYATGHIGKWHLGYTPETMPNAQGFDYSFGHMGGCIDNYSHFFYWYGPNRHDLWKQGREIWRDGEYFGDLMVEECKSFITRSKAKPFFVYWAINWPHYPLQGTDKWRLRYKDLPHPRDKYAAFISTTDELIGQVLDHLEKEDLLEDTIVLFQSDHGHSVEERTFGGGGSAGPYRGHKGTLFEGGIKVPSVISWPKGIPRGQVRAQFVTATDWFPTLAEWTGSDLPKGHELDGKSLAQVVEDSRTRSPHENYYWELGRKNPQWAVRQANWKLYARAKESVRPNGVTELSDADRKRFLVNLAEDPGETRNWAKEHPKELERLEKLAVEYQNGLARSLK
ncbi:MAG: sulfatase-like hydrolase/transferase [Verrucomicrobiota bacterium]|nr:sulfatase-like hydrolase/transferase [Verrucomicrobiota bacterium]